jgi:MFS family permease
MSALVGSPTVGGAELEPSEKAASRTEESIPSGSNPKPPNGTPRAPRERPGGAGEKLGDKFVKLWSASTTSAIGSVLASVATPLLVASRTSNPLVVSAAATIAWLPWLLFALPSGVLVDRLDRRRVMVTIDWARVGALAILGVALVAGHASIALLFAVLFIVSVGEVAFRSASQAFVPSIVPAPLLERANGWLAGGSMLTAGLFAGPLAGFLFAVTPSLPFIVNAGTYAASAILIGMIGGTFRVNRRSQSVAPATDEPVSATPHPSVWTDMVGGLRFLIQQRLLRTMAVLIGLLNVTLTAALAVLVLLAKERLHLGSVGFGALSSCLAVGGLLGSVFGDRIIRWVSATWTIRVGLLVEAGFHLVLATSHSAYTVGVAFLAFGVHGALWTIASVSLRQRLTPPDMLGRVGSASMFVGAGGNCVGAILGGALASGFGLATPYWVGFVVAVVVSATTWRVFNRAAVAAAYATPRGGVAAAEPAEGRPVGSAQPVVAPIGSGEPIAAESTSATGA